MSEPFDGRKLFIVEQTTRVVVLAHDGEEAKVIAADNQIDIGLHEVVSTAEPGYLTEWEQWTPFSEGDGPKLTCMQIVKAWREYEEG